MIRAVQLWKNRRLRANKEKGVKRLVAAIQDATTQQALEAVNELLLKADRENQANGKASAYYLGQLELIRWMRDGAPRSKRPTFTG